MLRVEGLSVAYGDFQVLWDVSLEVRAGEIVALLGPNGAGKSTLLNSVSGLVAPRQGRIEFDGRRVERLPAHQRVGLGLAHVLERRRLFPYLTVRQNLLLGAYHPGARGHRAESLAWVEALFPRLRERQDQLAHTLSGGEQQMVAIGRGLMARPRFLLVDEPTLGLAPRVVGEILDVLRRINRSGGHHRPLHRAERRARPVGRLARLHPRVRPGAPRRRGRRAAGVDRRSAGSSWASDRRVGEAETLRSRSASRPAGDCRRRRPVLP